MNVQNILFEIEIWKLLSWIQLNIFTKTYKQTHTNRIDTKRNTKETYTNATNGTNDSHKINSIDDTIDIIAFNRTLIADPSYCDKIYNLKLNRLNILDNKKQKYQDLRNNTRTLKLKIFQ